MPWAEAKGLLPGRGAPGRGPGVGALGRGPGVAPEGLGRGALGRGPGVDLRPALEARGSEGTGAWEEGVLRAGALGAEPPPGVGPVLGAGALGVGALGAGPPLGVLGADPSLGAGAFGLGPPLGAGALGLGAGWVGAPAAAGALGPGAAGLRGPGLAPSLPLPPAVPPGLAAKCSRTRRATGGSTAEDAALTNSPWSLSQAKIIFEVIFLPVGSSSFASS